MSDRNGGEVRKKEEAHRMGKKDLSDAMSSVDLTIDQRKQLASIEDVTYKEAWNIYRGFSPSDIRSLRLDLEGAISEQSDKLEDLRSVLYYKNETRTEALRRQRIEVEALSRRIMNNIKRSRVLIWQTELYIIYGTGNIQAYSHRNTQAHVRSHVRIGDGKWVPPDKFERRVWALLQVEPAGDIVTWIEHSQEYLRDIDYEDQTSPEEVRDYLKRKFKDLFPNRVGGYFSAADLNALLQIAPSKLNLYPKSAESG